MYNANFERIIRARGNVAASEDDNIAHYIYLNQINDALHRIDASTAGLEEEGLGSSAEAALTAMSGRINRITGEDTSMSAPEDMVLVAMPIDRLAQAISLVQLPTNDEHLFARMRRKRNGHYVLSDEQVRELAKQLQPLTITVRPGRVVLRNRIPGIESECPVPARGLADDLPPEGIAFRLKFHKLYNLVKPGDASIPNIMRRNHEADKEELLLLRLNRKSSNLQMLYNNTVLNFAVDIEPVPEPLLADLASVEKGDPFSAGLLSKSFSVIQHLGGCTGDVQVRRGSLSMHDWHALRVTAPGFDEHELSIPGTLIPALTKLFSWIRDGAKIRRAGAHYVVSKQNFYVVFAAGRSVDIEGEDRFAAFKNDALHIRLDGVACASAMTKPQCLCGKKERLDGVAMKIFADEARAAAICATRTGDSGDVNTFVTYLPTEYVSATAKQDVNLPLDPDLWSKVIRASSAQRVELFYSLQMKHPLLELHSDAGLFEIVTHSPLDDSEILKNLIDATPFREDLASRKLAFETLTDDEAVETEFVAAVEAAQAGALEHGSQGSDAAQEASCKSNKANMPTLGSPPDYDTFSELFGRRV